MNKLRTIKAENFLKILSINLKFTGFFKKQCAFNKRFETFKK